MDDSNKSQREIVYEYEKANRTDTQSQPPKPEIRRNKQYKLRTYLSNDAGHYLDQLAEKHGISRTAIIETIIRDQARREKMTE